MRIRDVIDLVESVEHESIAQKDTSSLEAFVTRHDTDRRNGVTVESVLTEGRDAPLYHGTSYSNAAAILAANIIEARTSQFLSGYKNRPTKGVSLSRNWRMSGGWGPVMFELDQRVLRHNHKIVPVNYGQEIAARSTEYAEAEEFVVGPISELDRCLLAIYVTRVAGRHNRDLMDALAQHPKTILVGRIHA